MSQANFIEENLNNLGELDKHDFKYLSEHTEQFYLEFSEKEISYIKYLYKLISINDFPNKFNRSNVSIRRIDEKIQFINQFNQRCYEENGEFYITPILDKVDFNIYKQTVKEIRSKLKPKDVWKQKIYNKDYYTNCTNYTFNEECAVSIINNEIINVLSSAIDIKTIDLMQEVVNLGGSKFECYEDDFRLYTSIGFMPISVCKWDDKNAPKKWLILNDMIDKNGNVIQELINNKNYQLNIARQDKIFFIYIGHKISISYNKWLQKVGYSNSYEEAKTKRDYVYNKFMEGK